MDTIIFSGALFGSITFDHNTIDALDLPSIMAGIVSKAHYHSGNSEALILENITIQYNKVQALYAAESCRLYAISEKEQTTTAISEREIEYYDGEFVSISFNKAARQWGL